MPPAWLDLLGDCFKQPQMHRLSEFLRGEKQQGKTIYPPGPEIFAAFTHFPPQQTKVIILGQDPYHGPGQACGLSFAVPAGQAPPPSLQNIYKELMTDLPESTTAGQMQTRNEPAGPNEQSGQNRDRATNQLTRWAQQGVLLLNSVLTVESGRPASHAGRGWEEFTDQVILRLTQQGDHLVFLLWGSYARKKGACIDKQRHCLIDSPHPSPLSAHRGFFGSRPFSRCNDYLQSHSLAPIDW
uniref:uracil-DNA glycosylase n=1 Tax=Candidatus Haliotispira prima TaxID=3034016 RepID=UPI0038992949